ncbi:protease HtpX [Neobacillus cucumis]|nr:protease HtpX [Neobacillus cucumis]
MRTNTAEIISKDFTPIIRYIQEKDKFKIKNRIFLRMFLFILTNIAIMVSLIVISKGSLLRFVPFLLIASILFPFIRLVFSKGLAKRSHKIKMIDPKNFISAEEECFYGLVVTLTQKTNIKKVPEVGIYESDDINAFATGRSKNKSLIAFSSGLLNSMNQEQVAAVTAHEIAHIANGDMVTLTLIQSTVNLFVNVVTLPILLWKWLFSLYSNNRGRAIFWFISVVYALATFLLAFLGSLMVKQFSRRREYKADALAAQLIDRDSMISALKFLKNTPSIKSKLDSHAAFKINSYKRWLFLLSTHPPIEKRIKALEKRKPFN